MSQESISIYAHIHVQAELVEDEFPDPCPRCGETSGKAVYVKVAVADRKPVLEFTEAKWVPVACPVCAGEPVTMEDEDAIL